MVPESGIIQHEETGGEAFVQELEQAIDKVYDAFGIERRVRLTPNHMSAIPSEKQKTAGRDWLENFAHEIEEDGTDDRDVSEDVRELLEALGIWQ